MPEGPTVHRLARDLTAWLGGQKIAVSSPQGRFADEAKLLDGRKLLRIEAWGKHLFYYFTADHVVHVHLGLYGKVANHAHPAPEPRGAVRLRLAGKQWTVDLNGPNQCELIDEGAVKTIVVRIGPDPLRADAKPGVARKRILESVTPLGMLLMDQSVISGIGNIYRCELLWLIQLHPRTPGKLLRPAEFTALWKLTKRLMELAVREGKIITAPAATKKVFKKLTQAQRFSVYKKTTCPRCGSAIEHFVMGGRNVFACAGCQELRK